MLWCVSSNILFDKSMQKHLLHFLRTTHYMPRFVRKRYKSSFPSCQDRYIVSLCIHIQLEFKTGLAYHFQNKRLVSYYRILCCVSGFISYRKIFSMWNELADPRTTSTRVDASISTPRPVSSRPVARKTVGIHYAEAYREGESPPRASDVLWRT